MRAQASILHLDLDAFFAAVEQRDKPSLRGRAVVVGGTGGRGVVATASYEARVFGVRSAMSTREARARCPHAAYLGGRFHAYREASAVVMALLRSVSPLVEPLSLDEAFIDLEEADLPDLEVGTVTAFAQDLRARLAADTGGLTASVGAATSKFVAKVASDLDKPDGLVVVPPGTETALLRPMRVSVIPGVGPATEERLRRAGIRTVADLERVGLDELVRQVGRAHGTSLHELAHARDDRAVVAEREAKSVSTEGTYETDLTDRRLMEGLLTRQAREVAARLVAGGISGRTVSIKVRLHDFTTLSRSATLASPTDRAGTVARVARGLLADLDTSGGVRLLGVGVSGLADWVQEDLFGQTGAELDGSDDAEGDLLPTELPESARRHRSPWVPGADVEHVERGRGWVWGAGRGVVTVRFETADTPAGPGASPSPSTTRRCTPGPRPRPRDRAPRRAPPRPRRRKTRSGAVVAGLAWSPVEIRDVDVADDELMGAVYDAGARAMRLGREQMPFWTRSAFLAAMRSPDDGERCEIVAAHLPDGGVAGWAVLWLPVLDNLDKGYLEVQVDPARARRGIGSALLEHLGGLALEAGRTRLLLEAKVPTDRVADHGYRRFAERHGYRYSNVEVVRHAALPTSAEDLDAWERRAAGRGASAYRLRTLVNELPPEIAPSLAVLLGQLGVDAPTGALDLEEEVITPQRLAQRLDLVRAMGRDLVETVALAEDGTVAAQTTIVAPAAGRAHETADGRDAWQWGTFVHREHRGRSLGLAVKTANLRAVQAAHPQVRRVTTQNAETNAWMIAINELLGFEPVEASLEMLRTL